MNKGGRPQSYDSYVKEYNKLKESMAKKGLTMRSKMLNKNDWEIMHQAMKNDRLKEINLGKRKIPGNINRDIAKMQQWEYSMKQAKAMQKVIKKQQGKNPLLREIRGGKVGVDFEQIKEMENALMAEGKSEDEARKLVHAELWGSP